MIQVNISEIKNRLSYYLRLVRGGEQIEILNRNTPLARMIHVSQADIENNKNTVDQRDREAWDSNTTQEKGVSSGTLSQVQSDFDPRKRVNLLSLKPCWKRGEQGDEILGFVCHSSPGGI